MRGTLLATTILAGTAVMAAGAAQAQDKAGPVELTVGGYMQGYMNYASQSDGAGPDNVSGTADDAQLAAHGSGLDCTRVERRRRADDHRIVSAEAARRIARRWAHFCATAACQLLIALRTACSSIDASTRSISGSQCAFHAFACPAQVLNAALP